ncbi:MAG: hypothetical protein ABSD70_05655 [Terracidiphilus sp.]|jgi:hypothetical protein
MAARKPPIAVLIVACLFALVGTVGLVRHFPRSLVFHQDDVWVLLTELLAIVAGVFLLRGQNWARWLALAWMAFHVAISWPVVGQIAVHTLILALIAWLLFRPDARRYFRATSAKAIPG